MLRIPMILLFYQLVGSDLLYHGGSYYYRKYIFISHYPLLLELSLWNEER